MTEDKVPVSFPTGSCIHEEHLPPVEESKSVFLRLVPTCSSIIYTKEYKKDKDNIYIYRNNNRGGNREQGNNLEGSVDFSPENEGQGTKPSLLSQKKQEHGFLKHLEVSVFLLDKSGQRIWIDTEKRYAHIGISVCRFYPKDLPPWYEFKEEW